MIILLILIEHVCVQILWNIVQLVSVFFILVLDA